jgi:hypothetical protein
MGIVQQADESDPNHGALVVHHERVRETSTRVRPCAQLQTSMTPGSLRYSS